MLSTESTEGVGIPPETSSRCSLICLCFGWPWIVFGLRTSAEHGVSVTALMICSCPTELPLHSPQVVKYYISRTVRIGDLGGSTFKFS